ncbi:MAG: bifunctional indole-3-glycerol phosphate synthase/phosphoribosylanthranilate isomerase, partial [Candidatus Blochmannia sp. A2]|nr:bifunctional indole-3-glycerol phosphate synthase/phosphoribosylanthranilate isomerase [Buchnera aphidicola]MDE5285022.1 bifunctional indole-3-glycerol phosphate synthase/phosphoribosylanthranilate isomerase [Candidatus Blochmannia sp. A2]
LLNNKILDNVIIAGGINVHNCAKASQFNCFGLDFNSGIEHKPGIKNHEKIKLIFQKLRSIL